MLNSISIENFAIVKELNLDLKPGLNIITGETGAGKSVIIEAISMALGSRADTSYIRSGQDKAIITLVVDTDDCNLDEILQEMGVPTDNPLILRREISQNSKSVCRVNGVIVPLSSLSLLCKRIADIHGQYDQQTLLDPDNHINILDLYGGEKLTTLKAKVSSSFSDYSSLKQELSNLKKQLVDSEKRRDYLKFEFKEISEAALFEGEDEKLEEEILLLENSEKLYAALDEVYSTVYSNDNAAISAISSSLRTLESISGITKALDESIDRFSNAYYELDDLESSIRNIKDSINYSQKELDSKIERLECINKLKRKYGDSIHKILEYADKIEKDISNIDNADDRLLELEHSIEKAKADYDVYADELSKLRRDSAKLLEKEIIKELLELNFNDARFEVAFNDIGITAFGKENCEFRISVNKGQELQSLAKVVSGGELSRIMLALKRILGDIDNIPSMIFDEIDTGISGATAAVVGEKLCSISNKHQVICITHLPQIASKGDNHFRIEKVSDEISTSTTVVPLGINARIEEIARLLSGSKITDSARKQAKELLELNG